MITLLRVAPLLSVMSWLAPTPVRAYGADAVVPVQGEIRVAPETHRDPAEPHDRRVSRAREALA